MTTRALRTMGLLALLVTLAACTAAQGAMTIQGYSAPLHDRFYTGTDRAFVAEGYDLSGVGKSSGGQWGTMISESYFLSAYHYQPSGSLTFYPTNTPGTSHTYAIAGGQRIAGTDLWLGKLATPLAAADGISWYSTEAYTGDTADYVGQTVYNYGQPHRVGRNEISSIRNSTDGNSSGVSIRMDYDYPGLGADETLYRGGDSGGPTFLPFGDELLLWGVHWYASSTYSGDSFVPAYADAIDVAMLGESLSLVTRLDSPLPPTDGGGTDPGDTDTGGKPPKKDNPNKGGKGKGGGRPTYKITGKPTASAVIPEPATLTLLAVASAAALLRRRRGR